MEIALPREGLTKYRSNSQRVRVATEAWGHANLYCPNCDAATLGYLKANTPAADFDCSCGARFQLKARGRPFGGSISDASYEKMRDAILGDLAHNLFVLHYEPSGWTVANLILVPHFAFPFSAIEKRPPLSPTARRAGWIGCNILLHAIPPDARIAIITDGKPASPKEVRREYARIRPLGTLDVKQRGWTLDVLNAVRSLHEAEFTLPEAYGLERSLAQLHPANRHVRDKIRQQLQVLRDLGLLEFVGRGKYRLK